MASSLDILKNLPLFKSLSESELKEILQRAEEVSCEPGEQIFQEGDSGGTMFIVLSGAVEISTTVMEDLQKPLVTLRDGACLGEVSIVDRNPRESKAVAKEKSLLLKIDAKSFDDLTKNFPAISNQMLSVITKTVVHRIRLTTELYRDNVRWGLKVSGALELNWQSLITDEVKVQIDLVSGAAQEGQLLKVEKSEVGYEIFLLDSKNKVSIIPYHAVQQISFHRMDVMSHKTKAVES